MHAKHRLNLPDNSAQLPCVFQWCCSPGHDKRKDRRIGQLESIQTVICYEHFSIGLQNDVSR
jgi:hypothetical protein